MNWVEILALAVMLTGILVGLTAAAILVGQRPAFWGGLVLFLAQRAWPYIKAYVTMRNTPEVEKQMQDCVRRGGEWDNFNKRCRFK